MNKPSAKTIQFRLTASYTTILALTFALIGVAVWLALNHSIQKTADHELRTRLADIRRYVDGFSAADLMHQEEEFREESLLSQSVANIRISDGQGKWLFHTPGSEFWPLQTLDPAKLSRHGRAATIRVRHELIRVLTAPVRVGVVEIGLPIEAFEEVKNGFLWLIGLGSPVLLLLSGLGGYWMSGRALQPVDNISKAAERISAQDLSARLPTNGTGDELDRLSGVLNRMLDRLESAFRRISEFTADASHELRTPAAIIHTTAELMLARPRSIEEHTRAWSKVQTETERTARLISDLLTLARSDASRGELEFHSIDLAEVVRTAAEEMRVMADAKGLQLSVTAPASCEMTGDADALARTFCILLDNAIKFTSSPGQVSITLTPGSDLVVKVSDTGVGMRAEELPMIFERFYRVSKDRSRQSGGAGLGLSIGRWIIERHGGHIRVESAPDEGSVFFVSLPVEHQRV